jgi:hypothetical protein
VKAEPVQEDMNIKSIRELSVKFKDNFAQAKDEVVEEGTDRPVILEEDADEITTEKISVLYDWYKKKCYGVTEPLKLPIKMILVGGEPKEERGRVFNYAYMTKEESPFWRFIFPGSTRNEEELQEVAKLNFHLLLDKEIQEVKHWVSFNIANIQKELVLYEDFKLKLSKFE